jgi:hypothetical protein
MNITQQINQNTLIKNNISNNVIGIENKFQNKNFSSDSNKEKSGSETKRDENRG